MKKFVIIDGNALIHRAFHALPSLSDSSGRQVQAVYGFFSVLIKVIKEIKPDYLAATFDRPEPTFRAEMYDEYKAKRHKAPQELYDQIPMVKEILFALKIPVLEKAGFEADDIIGTLVEKIKNQTGLQTIIVTGDLDTLQLVNKQKVVVFTLRKGMSDTVLYDEKAVCNRYGLTPKQLVDFKSLRGDISDNIPGVKGIGEKTAIDLLKTYKSLSGVFKNLNNLSAPVKKKIENGKEEALFSKELVKIRKDAPIDFSLDKAVFRGWDLTILKPLFEKYDFHSLLNRINLEENRQANLLEINQVKDRKKELEEAVEKGYSNHLFSPEIYSLEKRLIPVIAAMEETGILVDKDCLEKISKQLESAIKILEKKIWRITGENFNVASPQQLSDILFKKLNLPAKGLKKTPGGVISTASPELIKLRAEHPVIELIESHRELSKLKSTYTDNLVKLINPRTGRLHTTFNPLGTATGRISSNNPNLQNIPVRGEWGTAIRNCFKADTGYKLLSVDYSQIELRVAAHLSRDRKMISAFKKGEDIHNATAASLFRLGYNEITSEMRRVAKVINFGVLYGMSAQGFSERIGISKDKAAEFIEYYFREFKDLARYLEKIKEETRKQQYAETLFGRRRYLPDINSKNWQIRNAAERMAVNLPIQGTATGDIIKKAMVDIFEEINKRGWQTKLKILLQVHDELVFEVKNDILKEAELLIKNLLENTVKLLVPLVVSINIGEKWGEVGK